MSSITRKKRGRRCTTIVWLSHPSFSFVWILRGRRLCPRVVWKSNLALTGNICCSKEISIWDTCHFVSTGVYRSFCFTQTTVNALKYRGVGVAVNFRKVWKKKFISARIPGFILTTAFVSSCPQFSSFLRSHCSLLRSTRKGSIFSGLYTRVEFPLHALNNRFSIYCNSTTCWERP